MTHDFIVFFHSVAASCAGISGLFFLRFWRASRDPLFLCFCAAFWLIALSWVLLALVSPHAEAHPYIYVLRLLAFSLLIVGIVAKNARTSP